VVTTVATPIPVINTTTPTGVEFVFGFINRMEVFFDFVRRVCFLHITVRLCVSD
jgi:hypothetical protein